jgi:WhiB family transcriptional regulator, redox-sensing transcriptional regulator
MTAAVGPEDVAVAALLAALMEPAAWTTSALCAQADPEAWFPEVGGSSRQAKAVCARCPVRVECLAEAMANREPFGVWGGLSEKERRALRRRSSVDGGGDRADAA